MHTEHTPELKLSRAEQRRVHALVKRHLPAHFDREFIADGIIIQGYLNGLEHISREHVRRKCISEWRRERREQKRNEGAQHVAPVETDDEEFLSVLRELIDTVVLKILSPDERRLVWMRFYDDMSVEEIARDMSISQERVSSTIQQALYLMKMEIMHEQHR